MDSGGGLRETEQAAPEDRKFEGLDRFMEKIRERKNE